MEKEKAKRMAPSAFKTCSGSGGVQRSAQLEKKKKKRTPVGVG
jgi:hypothetical protein